MQKHPNAALHVSGLVRGLIGNVFADFRRRRLELGLGTFGVFQLLEPLAFASLKIIIGLACHDASFYKVQFLILPRPKHKSRV